MPLPVELSSDSGVMDTEYRARFFAPDSTAVQELRKAPDNCGRLTGKMTVFRSAAMPHDVTKGIPKITKAQDVPCEGSTAYTSTYVHDYKRYSIQQSIVTKNIEYSPQSTKTDGQSTCKEEFQQLGAPLPRPDRTNSNMRLSHNKFDTTVPSKEHCFSKAAPASGKSWKVTPAGEKALPFESTTHYRLHYICHPPQPKPLIQRLVYKPSSSPLNCVTTYRHDYSGLQVDVAKPIRSMANGESSSSPCHRCTKSWDRWKIWPLWLTCGHRTVVDSFPKHDVKFISTTHADCAVGQGKALPSTYTPKQAWTIEKVSSEALSTKGGKRRSWEAKKILPITQLKEPDKLVGDSDSTSNGPSHDMPKTRPLPHSFQPHNHSTPANTASTVSDATKKILPCSERGYRVGWADGKQVQRAPSARENSASHTAKTGSSKSKCSHSPKTPAVQAAVLTGSKRVN